MNESILSNDDDDGVCIPKGMHEVGIYTLYNRVIWSKLYDLS